MNNAYVLGFVKRAQEYGLNEQQAIELAKQANVLESLKGLGGQALDKMTGYGNQLADSFRNSELNKKLLEYKDAFTKSDLNSKYLLPARHSLEEQWAKLDPATKATILAAGGGAAVGGLGGAMIPSQDEETGETHRLRNALIGSLAGAGVGGAGQRYGIPAVEQAMPAIKAQLEKLRGGAKA